MRYREHPGTAELAVPAVFLTQRDSETDIVRASMPAPTTISPNRHERLNWSRASMHWPAAATRKSKRSSGLWALRDQHQPFIILLHGEPLTLTDKDFDLTLFLFQNQGRLLTREMLLERVWG